MSINSVRFARFERYEKGLERSFLFDLNALADFEEKTGMGFSQLMQTKAIYAATRALIWAGLKHDDRTLTMERVGELIGKAIGDGSNVHELMAEAMAAAMEQGAFAKANPEEAGKLRATMGRLALVAREMEEEEALAKGLPSDNKPILDVFQTPTNDGQSG